MRRLQIIAAALATLGLAASAAAQGRVMGVVQDENGKPIKGSTVRALNRDATPREWTSKTDDRGRFVLLGLRISDEWTFVADAPGFFSGRERASVRSNFGPRPVVITLRRDPGPPAGALSKSILDDIAAANGLRDEGRLDDALAAYEAIQTRNPKLTAVHLVMADVYRRKADETSDPAARSALLARASAAETAAADDPEPK